MSVLPVPWTTLLGDVWEQKILPLLKPPDWAKLSQTCR